MDFSRRATRRHSAATHNLTYQTARNKLAGGNTTREVEDEEMNQTVFGFLDFFGTGF